MTGLIQKYSTGISNALVVGLPVERGIARGRKGNEAGWLLIDPRRIHPLKCLDNKGVDGEGRISHPTTSCVYF